MRATRVLGRGSMRIAILPDGTLRYRYAWPGYVRLEFSTLAEVGERFVGIFRSLITLYRLDVEFGVELGRRPWVADRLRITQTTTQGAIVNETTKRGGAQPGGGRRAIDGSTQVERVTITLTEQDRTKLRSLGGSPWIRAQIRAAPPIPDFPSQVKQ